MKQLEWVSISHTGRATPAWNGDGHIQTHSFYKHQFSYLTTFSNARAAHPPFWKKCAKKIDAWWVLGCWKYFSKEIRKNQISFSLGFKLFSLPSFLQICAQGSVLGVSNSETNKPVPARASRKGLGRLYSEKIMTPSSMCNGWRKYSLRTTFPPLIFQWP